MIDKIAWLYIKDGQILTTRSKGKDAFYFPGGKREGIETDLETLTREIKAELSVDIRPDTTKPYGVFEAQAHGKAEGSVAGALGILLTVPIVAFISARLMARGKRVS